MSRRRKPPRAPKSPQAKPEQLTERERKALGDPIAMTAAIADAGFERALKHFKAPTAQSAGYTREWVRVLAIHARERGTRANETANLLSLAKLSDLKGDALRTLLNRLLDSPFLPMDNERSDAKGSPTTDKQALSASEES